MADLLSIARSERGAIFLPWLGAGISGLTTFLLRAIYLDRSYDIFIDEITYLHIARSVAHNLQVTLYGKTFYLHPPAFFFVEAGYLKLFQVTGPIIDQIYMTRYLNAVFAGLSAIAILWIAQRIAGWAAGLAAAAFFALDPFIIKMNSFNLLDTSALWWVLAGYWVLLSTMEETHKTWLVFPKFTFINTIITRLFKVEQLVPSTGISHNEKSITRWRLITAGLFFGLALLTKDMAAFLTLLPLSICFALNWTFPRWASALIATIAGLTYTVYPLTVMFIGDWEQFEAQKLRGFQRLAGVVKITGVNREGGPSLVEAVIARLDQFGTTYTLIALGVVGMCLLLLFGGPTGRLLGTWTASAYALLGYAALFGTLEEQFFYFLVLPSLLATATGATLLFNLGIMRQQAHCWLLTFTVVISLFFAAWSGMQWIKTHLIPDNGYERVLIYLRRHVPPQSKVAATSETAQFLLEEYASGPWGSWHSPAELLTYSPDYVLVTPHTLRWNVGSDAAELLEWIQQNGEPVFLFTGRGDSHLILYRLQVNR